MLAWRLAHIAQVEVRVDAGGLTNVGRELHLQLGQSARIGTMVAGNSGRPGGACGAVAHVGGKQIGVARKLHARHRTQEEDVVSNWLLTAQYEARAAKYSMLSLPAFRISDRLLRHVNSYHRTRTHHVGGRSDAVLDRFVVHSELIDQLLQNSAACVAPHASVVS